VLRDRVQPLAGERLEASDRQSLERPVPVGRAASVGQAQNGALIPSLSERVDSLLDWYPGRPLERDRPRVAVFEGRVELGQPA
jgi:hypothetical protein